MKFVYDTNIFIYHLNGGLDVERYFSSDFFSNNKVYTSRIVRIELLSHPNLTPEKVFNIEKLFDLCDLISLTEPIEELTIYFRKQYKLKFPDAFVAATAYQLSATLVTNNTKDFKNIPEVKIASPTRKK